jgi:hypothetical protein
LNQRAVQQRRFFVSGEVVPHTGIYRVFHGEHRLAHEVTALQGHTFPVCSKCSNEVHFELIRSAPLADTGSDFRVVLNSLPVLEEKEEEKKKRAKAS